MPVKLTDSAQAGESGPRVAQSYRNNLPCWRNFCQDLIYAGAYGGEAYLREVMRRLPEMSDRTRTRCVESGNAIQEQLAADYPPKTRLERAQLAWDKRDATLARFARWLPKRPLDGQAMVQSERNRRSGITEEQRQAQADEIAASL